MVNAFRAQSAMLWRPPSVEWCGRATIFLELATSSGIPVISRGPAPSTQLPLAIATRQQGWLEHIEQALVLVGPRGYCSLYTLSLHLKVPSLSKLSSTGASWISGFLGHGNI